MELKNKHIAVVGLGITGEAVARFLIRHGAKVTVTDTASGNQVGKTAEKLNSMGVMTRLGGHDSQIFHDSDMIILSPGVPHTLNHFVQARERGIPVIGEIELACRFISEPIIGVTGTNGKTTTTTLLGQMLKNSGMKIFVGGNIGNPLIDYVDAKRKAQWLVVELSSFQLDTIKQFRPKIALLLNITDDHMDRYTDFNAYMDSKARIFENQTSEDFAVLNVSDPSVKRILPRVKAQHLLFGQQDAFSGISGDCAVIENTANSPKYRMTVHMGPTQNWKPRLSGFMPAGVHNLENASAAILAALAAGGTKSGIDSALANFKGLSHRLEHIADFNGVDFINDSKATNTDAVAKALETFANPQIVIMGGRDKDSDFQSLTKVVKKHVKRLILIGEATEKIHKIMDKVVETETADNMDDAVNKAYKASLPGDLVLLAPGCASFDMYDNYKQRGEDFRRAVNRLISGGSHE
ncbi:MAG: UDP-N-acetylmuramoyl-L-alanine--D-glutamate ligase [Desulfobacterales bacterium]